MHLKIRRNNGDLIINSSPHYQMNENKGKQPELTLKEMLQNSV